MKAMILATMLLLPTGAFAKDKPECVPVVDVQKRIKADIPDAVFTKLTKGQYRFAEGIWAMDPKTGKDLPPEDGALLVSSKDGKHGLILWTKNSKVCEAEPLPEGFPLNLFASIKDGPGDEL